jgi:nucleotide-binding universal stress UspA family protein
MKPVLLATDGSPTAEKATDTAIELAKVLDTELIVVSVWNIPYPTVGFAPAPMHAEVFAPLEEDARKISVVAAARAEEAGVETRTVVLRGFPSEEICIATDTYHPQLVVIGSHGWGALKRAVFGSVSTAVLHHAKCPVLVVPGAAVNAEASANGTPDRARV